MFPVQTFVVVDVSIIIKHTYPESTMCSLYLVDSLEC
jgi:hypothetical protein